jgi:single-strand DNA-binding protein
MNINKVTVGGYIGRDIEMKALPSGMAVANFSIATTKRYQNRDGNQTEKTEWHNIVFFGKRAETVHRYFGKGSRIIVYGELQTRSWEKDGQKQYRTEIIGDGFEFIDKKGEGGSGSASVAQQATDTVPDYPEEEINPEDIPF